MMTLTQRQNLLQYLGYYEGRVDGMDGPLTQAAVEAFRKDNGMPDHGDELDEALVGGVFHGRFKGTAVPEIDFWSTVKYFGRHEFACKCGKYCDGYPVEPSETLVCFLDEFRAAVGLPVYVNSGVRCAAHNAAVGGASQSRHLDGDAADIRCVGKTPEQLYELADAMLPHGGVGLYDWGIHVDTRGHRARWIG